MPPKKLALKPWTKIHQTKYDWLYNFVVTKIPQANKDTYIDKYKRQLLGLIQNNPNWKDSSKEGLLFMISRYLFNKGDRYQKTYAEEGFKYMQKTRANEDLNQLDEKEKDNLKDHEYFISILEKLEKEQHTLEGHFKFLLLSLLVKQPPLRTSFYITAKFIRSKAENDHKSNFILINRRGKITVKYIVNQDKASNYKLYNMNKNLSMIDIIDDSLANLINDSYIKYPRTYLFEIKSKPITQSTFLRWLRSVSEIPLVNVDMMRSSYITWFYSKNFNFASRDKLSKIMRHSVTTAQRNYNKVTDNIDEIDPNKTKELQLTIDELKLKVKDLETRLEAFKSSDEDLKYFKKKRSDIMYNISKGRVPRNDTLKKYDIIFNEADNTYT